MLSKLENELRLIEENADNPQIADQHDRDFHLLLLQASGNRVLQVFSDVLIAYFEKTRESLPDNDCQYFLDTASKQRVNRPGFPGECCICELRLPDHRFRWKHNKLFLLLPVGYGPAFPAIVDCYTSPPT
ncbi:FCD domain-containing protein [Escherichia coli]|nr:FCD domain-containing protein [Escherichia coli]MCQ1635647.1 FCD domain-containing protein [Escherichia coli]